MSHQGESLCIVWAGVKFKGTRRGPFNEGIESIAFAEFCKFADMVEVMNRAWEETGEVIVSCCVLDNPKHVATLCHLGFIAESRTWKSTPPPPPPVDTDHPRA